MLQIFQGFFKVLENISGIWGGGSAPGHSTRLHHLQAFLWVDLDSHKQTSCALMILIQWNLPYMDTSGLFKTVQDRQVSNIQMLRS